MRPLNITIAGFGTYCNETFIDFTKLGSEGLYLITGNTGAGKTTIFDAITFALYGEPSGENRKTEMLRSSFADCNQPTFVKLEFEFREKKYFINRNPAYERANKKGTGTTTQIADASLNMPDGSVITGTTNVTNKIKEILGIDKNQFCQIAMIAQGDFQKLLFADSKTRQEFFRTLFKTEKFEKLQQALKDKVTELSNECKNEDKILKNQLGNIYCDSNNPFFSLLNKAKYTEMPWNEKIDIINSIIDSYESEIKRLYEIKKENQSEFDKVKLQLEDAKRLKADKQLYEEITEKIGKEEKLIESLNETVQVRKIAIDDNPEKEREKALIENEFYKYDDFDNKLKEFHILKSDCEKLEKSVSDAEKTISLKENIISEYENELASLKDVAVTCQKLIGEQEKLAEKINTLNELKNKYDVVIKLADRLEIIQNDYKYASCQADCANTLYLSKNKLFLDGQAGILAEKLEDNKPCPVCGSLSHPAPCNKTDIVPEEDELKELKKEADRLQAVAEEKSKAASAAGAEEKAKREEFLNSVQKMFGNSSDDENIDLSAKKIIEEIRAIEKKLEELKEKINIESDRNVRRNKLEELIPEERGKLEKLSSDNIMNSSRLLQEQSKYKFVEEQIEELKKTLKFKSKAEAKSRVNDLERKIDIAKKTYEDAVRKFNEKTTELNKLNGQLGEVKNRVGKADINNDEELNLKFNELSQKETDIEEKYEEIISRQNINRKALENINKNVKDLIRNEKQLSIVKSLSDTANGGIKGHERIQLEIYVQMAYFNRVLQFANTRLLIMTNGRYELVRKTSGIKLNSVSGLDIDVKDHYTGNVRNVKTLSGGECFQASLALALGLSDAVTSSAGGIKIDTMFIDEGFGSLDSENLQKAFEALNSVTQGNKLVGIISHVDYLKDKIDKQIIVTKTRNRGSSVVVKSL